MFSGLGLFVVAFSLLIVAITFYETIITKNWRNKVMDEDKHWKLAILYFNPSDRRIFLPKRSGLGFTINFANPLGVVFFLAVIIALSFMR